MKAFKFTVIVILVIGAVLMIVPVFLSSSVTVSRQKCMKAAPETVFRQVNKLKNWNNWSPFRTDSTLVITYKGQKQGVGAHFAWKGQKMGKGSLSIAESKAYSFIKTKLDFGTQGMSYGIWQFTQKGDSTCVDWSVHITNLKYPFGRWLGLMIKGGMKPFLDKGLSQLKTFSEQQKPPLKIEEKELTIQPVILINDSTTINGIGNLLTKNFGILSKFTQLQHIAVAGHPFAIYYNWNPQGYTKIGAGFPVSHKVKTKGPIEYFELPAGKTLLAKHFGSYNTSNTHNQINDYMKEHHYNLRGFMWEVYVTNPFDEPDTSKWETDIYYPVK